MEKLRINRESTYTVEVNDNGDCISFNLTDIELPGKLDKAYKRVKDISSKLEKKIIKLNGEKEKMPDGALLSDIETNKLEAYRTAYADMRTAMDGFLGDGASQKIFGDENYLEMWDDFFRVFEPHLAKMSLNLDGIKSRIAEKYTASDDGVLR